MNYTPIAAVATGAASLEAGVDRALLEELFDHTPDVAFFIKDAAGRYTTLNNSLVERHGLQHKAQMLGRRPCEVCVGSFGRIPTEQDDYVLRTGRTIFERLELHWLLPHRPVWCLTTKLPLRDANGRVGTPVPLSERGSALRKGKVAVAVETAGYFETGGATLVLGGLKQKVAAGAFFYAPAGEAWSMTAPKKGTRVTLF